VISGYYSGTGDFDPGSGSASLTSSGGDDMVFIKLNNSGDLTFAKSLGGISTDRASAVTVDGLGSILLAGAYSSTVDFDPGSGTNNLTSGGSTDIFLGKYGSDGTFNWAKGLGGSSATMEMPSPWMEIGMCMPPDFSRIAPIWMETASRILMAQATRRYSLSNIMPQGRWTKPHR